MQGAAEAAIDTVLTRDRYVWVRKPLDDKPRAVRVHRKHFVDWNWGGAVVMALGGQRAVTDRRYRVAVLREQTEPVSNARRQQAAKV